jgi:hypothetical protein
MTFLSFSGIFVRLMWLNTPDSDVSGKQSLLELKGMSHLIYAALITLRLLCSQEHFGPHQATTQAARSVHSFDFESTSLVWELAVSQTFPRI